MLKHRPSLALSAALMVAAASGLASMPGPSGIARTSARPPRPRRVQLDEEIASAREQEIAEWNAAVDRRKAEKKLGRSA